MIHFYYGDDIFSMKQHVSLIKEQFAKKYGSENVANLDPLDDKKTLAEIINTGLFSNKRLLTLEDVFSNKDLTERLPGVLPMVHEDTELIIIDSKPDKRTKLYKVLSSGKSREFILPKRLNQFVLDEASRQEVGIDKKAVDDLIAYTSGDNWRISNEIKKFKVSGIDITQENIKKFVEPDIETSAFHVLDDIFNRKKNHAIDKIEMLRKNEDPNLFFALLSSQAFALSVVKYCDKQQHLIAKEAGIHPYVVRKMYDSSKKITRSEVAGIAKIIAETDKKIKLSSREDAWDLIKLAVNKI